MQLDDIEMPKAAELHDDPKNGEAILTSASFMINTIRADPEGVSVCRHLH